MLNQKKVFEPKQFVESLFSSLVQKEFCTDIGAIEPKDGWYRKLWKCEEKEADELVASVKVLVAGLGCLPFFRYFQNRDVKYFKKTLIELQFGKR